MLAFCNLYSISGLGSQVTSRGVIIWQEFGTAPETVGCLSLREFSQLWLCYVGICSMFFSVIKWSSIQHKLSRSVYLSSICLWLQRIFQPGNLLVLEMQKCLYVTFSCIVSRFTVLNLSSPKQNNTFYVWYLHFVLPAWHNVASVSCSMCNPLYSNISPKNT